MVKAKRGGLRLGQIVGVPARTGASTREPRGRERPERRRGGQGGNGFAIMPLAGGQKVAVGVRGCDTILITAQDPNAVQFLAQAVFRVAEPDPGVERRPTTRRASRSARRARGDLVRRHEPQLDLDRRRVRQRRSRPRAGRRGSRGGRRRRRPRRARPQRGERAARPRRAEVPHRPARSASRLWPRCSSRSIARRRRSAVTLPPSGKISTASRGAEAAAHRLDLALDVAAARVHEAVRQPLADHVDQRVQRERLVHDDPRPAAVAAQQVVEHEQRVALAGVDAEHDHRPLARRRAPPRPPRSRACATRHARHAQRRPRDAADEPAQHRVVRAVPAAAPGRPQPARRRRRAATWPAA